VSTNSVEAVCVPIAVISRESLNMLPAADVSFKTVASLCSKDMIEKSSRILSVSVILQVSIFFYRTLYRVMLHYKKLRISNHRFKIGNLSCLSC